MENITKPSLTEMEKIFKGDLGGMLFFVAWLKNGQNSLRAYKELHPDVTEQSAQVLGSRQLSKIDRKTVMESYGLNTELYFKQLREGLNAMKRDQFSGEMYEDHKTRKDYHDKLGKLLNIENEAKNGDTNILIIPLLGGITKDEFYTYKEKDKETTSIGE